MDGVISSPVKRETVSSTWVHALSIELRVFIITTHWRIRHSLFTLSWLLTQATVVNYCLLSAILLSYLGWTFLGQHNGHSWCHREEHRNHGVLGVRPGTYHSGACGVWLNAKPWRVENCTQAVVSLVLSWETRKNMVHAFLLPMTST
jgi:hypothetical protein